jgi:hypothetical protein
MKFIVKIIRILLFYFFFFFYVNIFKNKFYLLHIFLYFNVLTYAIKVIMYHY